VGAAAGLCGHAAADAAPLPKVEITGSAIKRIEAETALPVQVITREEIDKVGVTTASEILARLSANVGGLTDGARSPTARTSAASTAPTCAASAPRPRWCC
jgi:iron complex outermembrane receptor protein